MTKPFHDPTRAEINAATAERYRLVRVAPVKYKRAVMSEVYPNESAAVADQLFVQDMARLANEMLTQIYGPDWGPLK